MSESKIDDIKKSLSEAASLGLLGALKLKETISDASEILHDKIDTSKIENVAKDVVSGAISSIAGQKKDTPFTVDDTLPDDRVIGNIHGINLGDEEDILKLKNYIDSSFDFIKYESETNNNLAEVITETVNKSFEKLSSLDRSNERTFTKVASMLLVTVTRYANTHKNIALQALSLTMQSIINNAHISFSNTATHELNQNLDPIYIESIKAASRQADNEIRDYLFDILAQSISTTSHKVREGMVKHFERVAHENFGKNIDLMDSPFKMSLFLVKEPLSLGAMLGKEGMSIAQKALTSIAKGAFSGAKEGIKHVKDSKEQLNSDKSVTDVEIKSTTDLGDVAIHAKYKED